MVKRLSHWLLSLIVLLAAALPSAGLYAGILHGSRAQAASVPALPEPRNTAIPKFSLLIQPPAAPPVGETPLPATPKPVPAVRAASSAPPKPAVRPPAPESAVSRYETTAYFLNVRSGPGSDYSILRTVEKGTQLAVTEKTDNGWLKLQNEGYVHGAYARPVSVKQVSPPEPEAAFPPGDQPVKPTSAVHSDSGLDEDGIKEILKGTALEGHGLESAILEIEEDFGINAFFTIAVMKLESGNGTSRLAKSKNNLFGLNATGGSNRNAYEFDSKADSVRKFGQIIARNYIGKGYTTVEKVARKYCPANSKWSKLVKSIMNSDVKKVIV
ncbi:glucosaminidase domain-containing protein [Cohnella caldifontis]|uniref:glucosaminidase domain-containing protein n=1 Tax=Cohnella caldifontis TaxID=3027471 RepID=UPI0023EC197E|nr:glucosaminidase domain-containing protein [Cohnella sp. YIM B05605]